MNAAANKDGTFYKVRGDWNILANRLRAKFMQLSDADLEFETGKEDELLQRIETRLRKERQEVVAILHKLNEKKFKLIR